MQDNSNPFISVVTPVYGCQLSLIELYLRLKKTLDSITNNYEIIMVNDASPDDSWKLINELAQKDTNVKGINLSRNFGQHYAITAGLENAKGDLIVVMDCDLQDQPEEIKKLINKLTEGYDVVFGRRFVRKDSFIKKLSSKLFYSIYNYLADSQFDNTIANFSISKKEVIDSLLIMREHNRSFPLFILYTGYNIGYTEIEHYSRPYGKTSYTLSKLINFATESIVSQSNKPLIISIKVGIFLAFMSLMFIIYLAFKKIIYGVPVIGWTSIMVSIFFMGGILLANMGIVGLYIGKIFNEVKNRPLFIIKDKINIDE
ncbi:MAG: glycosyltransferase family 2 protein [Bacteroidota bacterium]|nr:glycosyltransferase family 2 protein [Bacteroidota bacterium]